jgi:ABC-2 type transport system ATP-binding protein
MMLSTPLRTPVIETWGLRKEYGRKVAVSDLTLRVEPGEVFGFLGPNGAGKTTSVKMLLGLARPSGGEARLAGLSVSDHRCRARVGFLPEHFRFPDWLSAGELLMLHGELIRMERSAIRKQVPELLKSVGLDTIGNTRLRTFSKGMLQRVGLAQALLNDPLLVFLDEPTSGLDPLGRRLVRDIVKGLRERGTAVFLNSHLLSEVEVTCDRVAFIRGGAVVRAAPLAELEQESHTVRIRAGGLTPELIAGLARFGSTLQAEEGQVTLSIDGEKSLPEMAQYLVEGGARLYALEPCHQSLEDVFFEIVGKDGGSE